MVSSKKKTKKRKTVKKSRSKLDHKKIIYAELENGHPIVILPEHESVPEKVADCEAVTKHICTSCHCPRIRRHHKASFDYSKQKIIHIIPVNSDECLKTNVEDGRVEQAEGGSNEYLKPKVEVSDDKKWRPNAEGGSDENLKPKTEGCNDGNLEPKSEESGGKGLKRELEGGCDGLKKLKAANDVDGLVQRREVNGGDSHGGSNGDVVRTNRKGRPKGSKNKGPPLNMFNTECAKRAFNFKFARAECKWCGRAFEGSPLRHALQNHKSACPVCGHSCNWPSLTAHIRAHGLRQVRVTVTCYECYECKEKFGDTATMTKHVMDEHVHGDDASVDGAQQQQQTCCLCDMRATSRNAADWLREHLRAAHSDQDTTDLPDACGYCGRHVGRSALVEHLLAEHLRPSTVVGLMCKLCAVEFESRAAIVGHLVDAHCPMKTFSHPSVYRCRVCHSGFKSQINVLRHACNRIKTPYCAPCDKAFPSKMRYSFHLQFHEHPKHELMHLHCDLCLAEFDDENHLYDHIRFRHELHDKAVCEVCGRTFKSSMGLNIHRRYHNGSRNFTCKSCNKSFLNRSTLKEHEISHMDVKPFQCHICGQYLSRASRLRSHVKTHRAAESTTQWCHDCTACGFVAPNFEQLVDHAIKAHENDNPAKHEINVMLVVKCEFCDSTYVDAAHLDRHRNTAHDSRENAEAFICIICTSTFSSYSRLTTHKLTHGINMESAFAENSQTIEHSAPDRFYVPQYFSCQYCAKKCLHYTYFCLHRRLKHQTTVQSFTCDRCFLDFDTSWKLSYHKKIAHDALPNNHDESDKSVSKFKCTECFREFTKIGALNLHKTRTHIASTYEDAAKYLCQQCGKLFGSEYSVKLHSKTHYRELLMNKYHHQPEIIERYREPETAPKHHHNNIMQHTHTARNETVVSTCAYCYKTFKDKRQLIAHIKNHSDLNTNLPLRFVCELCDKDLENSKYLKDHLEDHARSNLVFLCRVCYVPFLSSITFNDHLVTHHAAKKLNGQPKIKFVNIPEEKSNGQPLVVECAKIFKEEPMSDHGPKLVVNKSSVLSNNDNLEPSINKHLEPPNKNIESSDYKLLESLNSNNLESSKNKNLESMNYYNEESNILDELLAIISTPRASPVFETAHYEPSDDIDDIFNSIIYNE